MARSARLRLLGEALLHVPFFAFVADSEMRYLAVNEDACRELGYEESQLLALTVPDIVSEPVEPRAPYEEMMHRGHYRGLQC